MTLLIIVIGLILLLLGRKALWLGVFAAVFLGASTLLEYILFDQPTTTIWIASSILAATSLVLFFAVEKAMMILLGALGGGFGAYLIISASDIVSLDTLITKASVFLIGGLLGILLIQGLYNWLVTVLSTLIGAYLVASLIQGQPIFKLAAVVILTIIGISIQTKGKITTRPDDYQEPYAETLR